MLGYDISWAGFNIIEVMSSSKFTCKRVGYLAAAQCFHADSEVCAKNKNIYHIGIILQIQNVISVINVGHEYDPQGS